MKGAKGLALFIMRTLAITFLILGCGKLNPIGDHRISDDEPKAIAVHPEMQPYYDRFLERIGIDANHIPSSFTELENDTVGLCWTYSSGYNEIEIDRPYWDKAGDLSKEELIFHELGHCALNLDHNEATIDLNTFGTMPESIMYPYVFGGAWYYKEFRNYYHKELGK